jgi:hypothetical protein
MRSLPDNRTTLIILRLAAIAGTILFAVRPYFTPAEIQSNQHYAYYALLFTAAGVIFSLPVLPKAAGMLFRNPDLLVPLGLYITVRGLLWLPLQSQTFDLTDLGKFDLTRLTTYAIGAFIIHVAAGVCFAGWTTRMILQAVEHGKADLAAAFSGIRTWYGRTFGILLLGMLPILLFLPMMPFILVPGVIFLFMVVIAITTPVWSLLTCAVLPYALSTEEPVFTAFKHGIRFSLSKIGKTIFPIFLQLLIAGWIVILMVSYTKPAKQETFGESQNTGYTTEVKSQTNVNFVDALSYEDENHWYKDLMKAVEAAPLPTVDLKIELLMLILAIVVKLQIVMIFFGGKRSTEFDEFQAFLKNDRQHLSWAVISGVAVICLVPFELLGIGRPALKGREAALEVPKIYTGQETLRKEQLFKWNRKKSGDTGAGSIITASEGAVTSEPDEFNVENIVQIYAGEVDQESGTDILVAGRESALILDRQGNIKREISYNLGRYFDQVYQNYDLSNIKIVDLDGDGIPEIAGYGGNACAIVDMAGKTLWRFRGDKDYTSAEQLDVDDINNDGKNEIIITDNDNWRGFDASGKELWKKKEPHQFGEDMLEIADFDGDGKKEVLINKRLHEETGAGEDKKEDPVKQIDKPYRIFGVLHSSDEKPLLIFFGDDNKLGLFDIKGNLAEKYDAPLSSREMKLESDTFYKDKYREPAVFRAKAIRVKLRADEQKYLVVLATGGDPENYDLYGILYVYAPNGKLIYNETFHSFWGVIAPLPEQNGTESLLVTDNGRLYSYSLN